MLEHRDMLTKDLGVDAVLSIVEDFELDCSTAIGRYRTFVHTFLHSTYIHTTCIHTYIHTHKCIQIVIFLSTH